MKHKKLKKGEHNYINYKKRSQLIMTFVYVLVGLLIFILGLFLNKFQARNIFSVLAVMMVLPAAKRFVNFIVFARFKSVSKEQYEKVSRFRQEEDVFYTDVVFTSSEKIMFLSFLVVAGNEVIGLLGNAGQDREYIKKYLEDGIRSRGLAYKMIVCDKEEEFIRKYKKADRGIEVSGENRQELTEYLWSLIVE